MPYSVTLEHGSDGSCLAWVHELPGCFTRGASRGDALAKLPRAIDGFSAWLRTAGEIAESKGTDFVVVEEVESVVATAEDTEALVGADRAPLTVDDWSAIERWLARSRADLLQELERNADRLDARPGGSGRNLREELVHIALVELMYVAWTFDLQSTTGLRGLLAWTRRVAVARMRELAEHDDGTVTYAAWAGAPRAEEWTARKAARRLVWHERLHMPSLRESEPPSA
jgi:predicted RNase H-like HicB family nuclease